MQCCVKERLQQFSFFLLSFICVFFTSASSHKSWHKWARILKWAHTEVVSCFSYTVLLHFLKDYITGFAVSQSAQNQHLNQRSSWQVSSANLCVHSGLLSFRQLFSLCLVLTLSEAGDHFAQTCSPCSTLLTAQNTSQTPKQHFFVKYSCHKTCLGISQMFRHDTSSKKSLKPEATLTFQRLKLRID